MESNVNISVTHAFLFFTLNFLVGLSSSLKIVKTIVFGSQSNVILKYFVQIIEGATIILNSNYKY